MDIGDEIEIVFTACKYDAVVISVNDDEVSVRLKEFDVELTAARKSKRQRGKVTK